MKWCFCCGKLKHFFFSERAFSLMEIDWVQFSYREHTEEILRRSIKWAGKDTSSHCNKRNQHCANSCNSTFRMQVIFFDHWPGNLLKSVCLLLLILNNSLSIMFVRNNEKTYRSVLKVQWLAQKLGGGEKALEESVWKVYQSKYTCCQSVVMWLQC